MQGQAGPPRARGRRAAAARALAFCLALAALPESIAASSEKKIDLEFTPTENITAPIPATKQGMFGAKIRLLPIRDAREIPDQSLIGRMEDGRVVRATGAVGEFVSEVVEQVLTEWGLQLSEEGGLILSGDLIRFNVDVQTLFSASVNLRFRLSRSGGESLWEGLAMGDARRFGLARSEGNYNETLSDALKEALAGLMADEGFQDALIGRVPAAHPSDLLLSPEALLTDLLNLKKEGLSEEMLLAYVGQRTISGPITAAMIIQWKQAGLSEKVIQEAMRRVRQP